MAKKDELLTVENLLSVEEVKDLLEESKDNMPNLKAVVVVSVDRKGFVHQHNAGFPDRSSVIGALEWAKIMVVENG